MALRIPARSWSGMAASSPVEVAQDVATLQLSEFSNCSWGYILPPSTDTNWNTAEVTLVWCPGSTSASGNVRLEITTASFQFGTTLSAGTPAVYIVAVSPGGGGDQYQFRATTLSGAIDIEYPNYTAIRITRSPAHILDTYGGNFDIAEVRLAQAS